MHTKTCTHINSRTKAQAKTSRQKYAHKFTNTKIKNICTCKDPQQTHTQRSTWTHTHADWFSPACSIAMVHRNHFFRLYENDMTGCNRPLFISARKRVLKEPKLLFSKRMKQCEVCSRYYCRFCKIVLNNPSSIQSIEVRIFTVDKVVCFAGNFSSNTWFIRSTHTLLLHWNRGIIE